MPNVAIETFTDPHEYQSAVRATDVSVLLTGDGPFRVKLTRMDLHRLWMRTGESSRPYIMQGAWTNHRCVVSFLVGHDQTPYRHNGQELPSGSMLINPLGTEFSRRSTGRQAGSMSLSPDDLASAGLALDGRELAVPAATLMVRPSAPLMSRLLHLYEAAQLLTETAPDILTHPEVARAMEDGLIRAMVACLAEGNAISSDDYRSHRMPVIQRLNRFLEENPDRPLYLTEICAAIGIAARTLRLHCLEHFGISPHRYLWLRRMHQAQHALSRADAAVTNVTQIATDHGFGELGRFSVTYKKLFGEQPSATLRRTSDDGKRAKRIDG